MHCLKYGTLEIEGKCTASIARYRNTHAHKRKSEREKRVAGEHALACRHEREESIYKGRQRATPHLDVTAPLLRGKRSKLQLAGKLALSCIAS